MASTSYGSAPITLGSITICCSSLSLFYTIYVVLALGSALNGLFSGIFAGIALDNVLMIVAGSLAIIAAKHVVNKGLWVAAIVVAVLSSFLYLAAIIFLGVYGAEELHTNLFSATRVIGLVINLCLQVGLLISVCVGLHMAKLQRTNRPLEIQMPPAYSQQPQSAFAQPQMEAPPRYDDKAMLVA